MGPNWEPIADLGEEADSLASLDLASLRKVWCEQKEGIERDGLLATYTEQLCRDWAIETGILERLYTLDRGIATLLIERGIDASLIPHDATDRDPNELAAILEDHRSALEGLFAFVKGGRPLSTSYVKELHAALTRGQPSSGGIDAEGRRVEIELLHGEYKRLPNNPARGGEVIHEYAPPEQVAAEMERLIAWHREHIERGVAPEVEAAWLHHRFTQIHPFQDGNGRVARALASLVMIRAGLFPVVIRRDDRVQYIESLESADDGSLRALVELIVGVERQALVTALGLVRNVRAGKRVEQVIAAAKRDLEERERRSREEYEGVRAITSDLFGYTLDRFQKTEQELCQALIGMEGIGVHVSCARPGDEHDYYFRRQIVETAKALGYYADLGAERAWVRLTIGREPQHNILVSFHGLGSPFRGIMAVSSCTFQRSRYDERTVETEATFPLADEVFQFNYQETLELALARLRPWLEQTLVRGLERWRRGL